MPDTAPVCICGHIEAEHNDKYGGCASRCLCELCDEGTRNDCWCAGWKPEAVAVIEKSALSASLSARSHRDTNATDSGAPRAAGAAETTQGQQP